MKLILLGPPGAGKGTLAESLSKKLNLPILSTGNILRDAVTNETQLGKKAKAFMDAGKLVTDDLIIALMDEKLSKCDGFILDGFPRTIAQAEALDKICDIDIALSLDIDDEVIIKRMTGRRTCPKCGMTYHLEHNPPKSKDICDKCSSELIIRSDDNEKVVIDRLETYHKQTKPLKDYYINKLKSLDAALSIDVILNNAIEMIKI